MDDWKKALEANLLAASKKHDLVPLGEGKLYTYGTAGFRMNAKYLDAVSFRVGLLAALRTRKWHGQAIGVMITASHNPAVDNGVKIVDPLGEMLEQEWEGLASALVNAPDHEQLVDAYFRVADAARIDLKSPGKVIVGRDTRPSGIGLVTALSDACEASNTTFVDYKILTTPQLHYLTRATNTEGSPASYGKVSETGYYEKLSNAFARAMKGKKVNGVLTVDCANGVGGPKLKEFLKYIDSEKTGLKVNVVNDDVLRPEVLNLEVRVPWPCESCIILLASADRT